jgi:hypothetical protein
VTAVLFFLPAARLSANSAGETPAPQTPVAARSMVQLTLAGVVAIALAGWSVVREPAQLAPDGSVDPDARFVALKPDTWVGSRLPLLDYVEASADLSRSAWLVVLYRPDCDHCQKLLPKLVDRLGDGAGGYRLALIDTSSQTEPSSAAALGVVYGRLPATKQWLVTPPVGIRLVDGQVRKILDRQALDGLITSDSLGLSE